MVNVGEYTIHGWYGWVRTVDVQIPTPVNYATAITDGENIISTGVNAVYFCLCVVAQNKEELD